MSSDDLHLAKTYPYSIPDHSFVMLNGAAAQWTSNSDVDLSNRRPVLAVGSNQSPDQLARKFVGDHWGSIPVSRAVVHDYDAVYSPHVSAYGAIPATLHPSPGTATTLFINWLTPEQEVRMHVTEISAANYGFGTLEAVDILADRGPDLSAVYLYAGTRGALNREGNPIPLAEVPATDRRWRAMTQMEVQAYARDRVGGGNDVEMFIRGSVNDAALRKQRTNLLANDAHPFDVETFRTISIE